MKARKTTLIETRVICGRQAKLQSRKMGGGQSELMTSFRGTKKWIKTKIGGKNFYVRVPPKVTLHAMRGPKDVYCVKPNTARVDDTPATVVSKR
jgi:hypothetical protein